MDVQGSQKFSFTTHVAAHVKFCFTATLTEGQQPGPDMKRSVFLHVDTEHTNYALDPETKSRFQAMESEANWLLSLAEDAVTEMHTFEVADRKMFDIIDATKARVFNASGFTIFVLIVLGACEVW